MKRILSIAVLAGCGHPAPAASPHEQEEPVVATTTPDATVAVDPNAGCWQEPAQVALVPETDRLVGFHDGGTVRTGPYWYCDLPDRVVLVDPSRTGKKQAW